MNCFLKVFVFFALLGLGTSLPLAQDDQSQVSVKKYEFERSPSGEYKYVLVSKIILFSLN